MSEEELVRRLDRIENKLDSMATERMRLALDVERIKTHVKFIVGGLGFVMLGGGGVGALLKFFG